MRSPTKISPKWCGFRSSCNVAYAPHEDMHVKLRSRNRMQSATSSRGERRGERWSSVNAALAHGSQPASGQRPAGTPHTTHLLWRAKGKRVVLVLLRRIAIRSNLPCSRRITASRQEHGTGTAGAAHRASTDAQDCAPCWRTAARCRRGGTSCRWPRRPAQRARACISPCAGTAHPRGSAPPAGGTCTIQRAIRPAPASAERSSLFPIRLPSSHFQPCVLHYLIPTNIFNTTAIHLLNFFSFNWQTRTGMGRCSFFLHGRPW